MANIITYFSEVYGISGLVLYFTLGHILSTSFRSLRHELISIGCNFYNQHRAIKNSKAISDKAIGLKLWRRRYLILLETMSNFEHCFGPILLFWTAHVFITAISSSYFLVCKFQQKNLAMLSISIPRLLVHIFMMAIIPANLHREVVIFLYCIKNRFSKQGDETIMIGIFFACIKL